MLCCHTKTILPDPLLCQETSLMVKDSCNEALLRGSSSFLLVRNSIRRYQRLSYHELLKDIPIMTFRRTC